MTSEEVLRRSAPLAFAAAPTLCPAGTAGCSWYHGPWQYFRLLKLVSTATVHEAMLVDALRAAARDGRSPRVLVSGSTDYAMLALVLDAYAQENQAVDVTVVDLCPTPLHLCEWYAREQGVAIHTQAANILEFNAAGPFDVICTHAFMGYFDAAARAALTRKWHALLRPDGRVITTQRLRPGAPDGLVRFTPEQAADFRRRADEALARHGDIVAIEPEQFSALAREFTERFVSHPIRAREELAKLFTDAGFRFGKFDIPDSAPNRNTTSGPSVPGASEFVQIVAMRN